MNYPIFLEEIRTFSQLAVKWRKPIHDFLDSYFKEHHSSTNAEMRKMIDDLNEIRAKIEIEDDLQGRLNSFLDQHFHLYLSLSKEECNTIRAVYRGNHDFESMLFSYTNKAISQYKNTGEEVWLLRGLVSSSLDNCGTDYIEFEGALSEFVFLTGNFGVNPAPHFRAVALISGDEVSTGAPRSVSEMMIRAARYAEEREKREARAKNR